MARVTGGLFDKMSGMLANQVYYRVINGKTYVSAKPKKRKKVERGKLPEGNKKFIKASHYATKAMIKPERKAIYQSVAGGLTTAYSMAIADFMKAPEIGTVSTREYRGKPGDKIWIKVINIVRVEWVNVSIESVDGHTLEQGEAIPVAGSGDWVFTATGSNPVLTGTYIHIAVKDLPGNLTTSEIQL